jgi:hypothetical protein
MKEAHRQLAPRVKVGYDILFIARNTIVGSGCPEIARMMKASLKKGKLFE